MDCLDILRSNRIIVRMKVYCNILPTNYAFLNDLLIATYIHILLRLLTGKHSYIIFHRIIDDITSQFKVTISCVSTIFTIILLAGIH